MAKTAKPGKPPKSEDQARTTPSPPPPRDTDDDYEDGDIATPKRDLDDSDDEPL